MGFHRHSPWVPLRSSDPEDDDFSDLAPLAAAVADARVVLLGEPSHGDGASFRLMDRLIRFLHRELCFEVLAWESERWGGMLMDAAFDRGLSVENAVEHSLGDAWRSCEEVFSLLEYVRGTRSGDSPLRFAGVDPMLVTPEGGRLLAQHFLDRLPSGVFDGARLEELLGALGENPYFVDWAHGDGLRRLLPDLEKHVDDLDGLIEDIRVVEWLKTNCPRIDNPEANSFRDARMAANLIDLAERVYPDRKIVLRAMNGHILRSIHTLIGLDGEPSQEGVQTLAELAWRHFGKRLYSIVFLAGEGTYGWSCSSPEHHRELEPPAEGSVESDMLAAGHEQLFVDLRGLSEDDPLRGTRLARPIAYVPVTATWDQVCDGFVFTRRMYPATAAKP